MATYFVQTTSAWENDRWHTWIITKDKALAEWLAEALEIGENEYGIGNPGLRGVRYSRAISKTRLIRQDGRQAYLQALDDVERGFDDPRAEEHLRKLLELYEDEKKEKEAEGKVDFLVRDMPGALHAAIKEAAAKEKTSIRDWILRACEASLKKT